jgi:(2Fe-2S) ferredoxin
MKAFTIYHFIINIQVINNSHIRFKPIFPLSLRRGVRGEVIKKLFIMKKPDYHILVCNSFRIAGDAQGACNKKGATDLLQYISEEASDRGLDIAVSTTACLNVCSQGPVMVIHPNNFWYGGVESEAVIDEIFDALEEDELCEKYSIAD